MGVQQDFFSIATPLVKVEWLQHVDKAWGPLKKSHTTILQGAVCGKEDEESQWRQGSFSCTGFLAGPMPSEARHPIIVMTLL